MEQGDIIEIVAGADNKDGKSGKAKLIRQTEYLVLVELNGSLYWFDKSRVK